MALTAAAQSDQAQPGDPAVAACAAIIARAERELSEPQFKLWFSGLEPGRVRGEVLEIVAPSPYVKSWLASHYMDFLTATARQAVGSNVRVRVRVPPPSDAEPPPAQEGATPPGARPPEPEGPATAPRQARGTQTRSRAPHADQATLEGLDRVRAFPEAYTFDTFVLGPSNKFAHAAALAVAEAPPSHAYNPLFIYGGVGLGKTHLLFAIASHVATLAPRSRVRYVTSESFVTEFIRAVRERRGYQFQREFRDVDFLLLDDVQFLANKEETQTEFFHTFNHLHQHGRQIVIASDRPPQDLGSIEDRLRSRFRSGLVVDIQPADLETRVAILQLKAIREQAPCPDDVLLHIASKFDQSIRDLEGALHRVVAFASLLREPITLALAERALEGLLPTGAQETAPGAILELTASYFNLSVADLVSKSRSRPLTTARHVAMYLLREQTGLSLIKIGDLFDRDHTTVMHGIKKVEALMKARGGLYRQVQELTRSLRAPARAT
jgi:chromosomal replication initiator protein